MMGSPLADALADYRDQLAPASAAAGRPRPWRWWVLLALVGLVLGGGAVALLPPTLPSPTVESAVTGPADAEPVGTGQTPPAGGGGVPDLATPPAAGWEPMVTPIIRTWLPRIPGAGPADPLDRGFTRTPAGALAAAATLYPLAYYSYPEAAWTPVAEDRVVWAPGQRESLERGLAPVWAAQLPTPLLLTPVGYRPISYTADRAQVRLWWQLDYPDARQVTIGAVVEVVWRDGDWSLYFDEPVMDSRGVEPTDSYLGWGPA
jgi:hypothetical protein